MAISFKLYIDLIRIDTYQMAEPAAIAMSAYTLIYFVFAPLTIIYYRLIVRSAL
jgi:hypothetical protein